MKRLTTLWRENRLLVMAFLAALSLAIFFGVGALRHARDFNAAPDQPIKGWMTPRYVAFSWDLPREFMIETLEIERYGGRVTLKALAEEQGVLVEELIKKIEAAIAAHRAEGR